MPDQLEFPLVSAWLAGASPERMERDRVSAGLPIPLTDDELLALEGFSVRLNYLYLVPDEGRKSLAGELEELRCMIGGRQWCLDQKFWRSLASRNPRGVRRAILAMKKRFNL